MLSRQWLGRACGPNHTSLVVWIGMQFKTPSYTMFTSPLTTCSVGLQLNAETLPWYVPLQLSCDGTCGGVWDWRGCPFLISRYVRLYFLWCRLLLILIKQYPCYRMPVFWRQRVTRVRRILQPVLGNVQIIWVLFVKRIFKIWNDVCNHRISLSSENGMENNFVRTCFFSSWKGYHGY